jgi:hypothetical protein
MADTVTRTCSSFGDGEEQASQAMRSDVPCIRHQLLGLYLCLDACTWNVSYQNAAYGRGLARLNIHTSTDGSIEVRQYR